MKDDRTILEELRLDSLPKATMKQRQALRNMRIPGHGNPNLTMEEASELISAALGAMSYEGEPWEDPWR